MTQDELKKQVARAALKCVVEDAIVGVGSGSTVDHFIDALAGMKGRIEGAVAASERSAERLKRHGIHVFDLNAVDELPVYIDGADEVTEHLYMIKGGGGALTREKIVAAACGRFVCIVDGSKCVERLGRFPLPIDVVPMARELVASRVRGLGARPALREGFVTDNGNRILDVTGLDLSDPEATETEIESWPGVVTVGLFAVDGADLAIIATPEGVVRRSVSGARG